MTTPDESAQACQLSAANPLPPTLLRTIGYWVDDDRPDLPDPVQFADPGWQLEERKTVAKYLNANRSINVGCGCSPCRICGAPNGFEEFTDGTYLWPEGLAHYVLDHAVRLPAEFVKHVLTSSDTAQTVGLVDHSWWVSATE